MNDLKDLLLIYSHRLKSQELFIGEILKTINQITNLNLSKEQIEAKNRVLKFKVKPKEKLEVLLNKETIISSLKNQDITINDLR